MPNLFLFTHHYPYKEGAETFIENEINIASIYFEKIFIIPMYSDSSSRRVPSNVVIIKPAFFSKKDIIVKGLLGLNPKIIKSLTKEFFKKKYWKKYKVFRSFLIQSLIFSSLLNSESLKEVKCRINIEDILYSYWGTGWGTIIPFVDELPNRYFVRFHGGDLYEELRTYLLFREPLLKRLTKAIFISKQGEIYQKNKFPQIKFDSMVSYLGTSDHGISKKSTDGKFRILSCSHVNVVKRVDLIFKALLKYDNPNIEWTHIGGQGEEFESLKKIINDNNHMFKVNLVGSVSNSEVIEYYRNHLIDAFINVSSSEGLPVSIMEAISFGIPAIATAVGGTAEIINHQTGVLLPPDPSEEEIVNALKSIQKGKYNPRKFWEESFKAETNYVKFYNSIL